MENVIIEKYTNYIQEAMLAHDVSKRETFKMIKSKLKEFETQKNAPELTEAVEIQILNKFLKNLHEEHDNYIKVGNTTAAEEINNQIATVEYLLPNAASSEEMASAIDEYISEHGAITNKDFGSVMTYLGQKFKNIDRRVASNVIKEKIQ